MQLLLVFLLDDLLRLAMGHQKPHIVHLGVPSLNCPQIGRGSVPEGEAERGEPEGGHVAAGKH